MRGLSALAPAMLALGLGACDSFRGWQEPIESTATVVKGAGPYTSTELVDQYHKGPPEGQRAFRDRVIDQRLLAVNARFYHFTKELREGKVGTGLGGDIIKLVLGAVGAVTGTAATKSILSAASGGVTGATASFDKHVFYEQALPALIAQMSASRDKIIKAVRDGQKKDVNEFSLGEGLELLQRLEQAGSIEYAIAKITEKATADANAANASVLNIETSGRTDDDKRYLLSTEGRTQVTRINTLVNALPMDRALALAIAPKGISNADGDKAAQARMRGAGNISLAQARAIIRTRVELAKGKAELDTWETLVK